MRIVSLRFPPAELAALPTEPRFPAQRWKSTRSDDSSLASIRICRISFQLRAARIRSSEKRFGTFFASSFFCLSESRKRSGPCVVQLPEGARPPGGQESEG
jgi:hypothetical protein